MLLSVSYWILRGIKITTDYIFAKYQQRLEYFLKYIVLIFDLLNQEFTASLQQRFHETCTVVWFISERKTTLFTNLAILYCGNYNTRKRNFESFEL